MGLYISKHSALKGGASRWLLSLWGWRRRQEVVNTMCPNCHLLSRSLAQRNTVIEGFRIQQGNQRILTSFTSSPTLLPSLGRDASFPSNIHVPLLPKKQHFPGHVATQNKDILTQSPLPRSVALWLSSAQWQKYFLVEPSLNTAGMYPLSPFLICPFLHGAP